LPLPKTAKVLLAGTAADSKAKQCGGWTIDWQGLATRLPPATSAGPASDTTATTIRQGIEAVLGAGNVAYASSGTTTASGITHAIVVVGEAPYAETSGDKTNLELSAVSAADIAAITNATNLGVPTVVVVVSGRPLIITDQLASAGAWLAAWLPGSEGDGVADVLFGDYKPTGKLSHSWPKTMSQIPINVGDADYTSDPPLFAYGFGLSY
jgi:beta-glucosidase